MVMVLVLEETVASGAMKATDRRIALARGQINIVAGCGDQHPGLAVDVCRPEVEIIARFEAKISRSLDNRADVGASPFIVGLVSASEHGHIAEEREQCASLRSTHPTGLKR